MEYEYGGWRRFARSRKRTKNGKFWPDSYALSSNILLVNKVKRKPIGGPQKPISELSTCVEVKENATSVLALGLAMLAGVEMEGSPLRTSSVESPPAKSHNDDDDR